MDRIISPASVFNSIISSFCPTCGEPCINPNFCATCRDADRRKAHGERPRYSTPERPIDWSESKHLAFLRHMMSDEVSLDRAWNEINHAARKRYNSAPQPTVEALMYSLRSRGTKALEELATKRRLPELGEQQLHEICGRLQRLKPTIARAWTSDEIIVLVDTWSKHHG